MGEQDDQDAPRYEAGPARRERTPIQVGIIGPSGSGKTKSALRLADGMARVNGGDTGLIDTNNRRSLHHADAHKFKVLHMPPPYSPRDFGAASSQLIGMGVRRIIVDSMSDEWEGEGGVLDMHEDELDRRAGADYDKRDKNNQAAWILPKREHNRLKLWMFQQPVDWIITFRAKEKSKPKPGKGIEDLGWQPLGAEDLIYELLLKCLLRPQADGKPVWTSDIIYERNLFKLPGWFRDLFTSNPVLSEDIGEQLARWAAGADVPAPNVATPPLATRSAPPAPPADQVAPIAASLIARFEECSRPADYVALDAEMRADWERIPKGLSRQLVNEAFDRATARSKRKSSKPT